MEEEALMTLPKDKFHNIPLGEQKREWCRWYVGKRGEIKLNFLSTSAICTPSVGAPGGSQERELVGQRVVRG